MRDNRRPLVSIQSARASEAGKVEARHPSLLPELGVPRRKPGEAEDHLPKQHCSEARHSPDRDGKHKEAELG